jgi:exosortase
MQMPMSTKLWIWRVAISVPIMLIMAVLLWSYWPTFAELAEEWSVNPLYSHGYLVPAFAVALLWFRRDRIPASPFEPSLWAVGFLIVGCVMRLGSAYYYFSWPDRASLLVMLIAVALAVGGWAGLRWTWPSILFLLFMLPFPGFVESGLTRPLRRVATLASTNVLQTLGFFAQADGNVIVLSEGELGIIEACSGLGMLSVFVAMTVGACFLVQRPLWQKVVIVLSSLPIAVLCNVARISATGMFIELAESQFAHKYQHEFHDWAGWLMMPLALVLLLLELKFLDLVYQIYPVQEQTSRSKAAAVLG